MPKKDYSKWSKEELARRFAELEKRKKYGLVWDEEKEPELVVMQCKEKLPVLKEVKNKEIVTKKRESSNILIEGDNYHALSVLNYTHKGAVDVIYIDPPYNTGAKNWRYNNNYVEKDDAFRHSKWLNMMDKRLWLAKLLLKRNGVLICAIDENELWHLGCLLEEVFSSHEIHLVTIIHNPRGVQGKNFSYINEFAYFVLPKGQKIVGHRKLKENEIYWSNLRNWGGESLRTDARNCFYPIIVKNNKVIGFGEVPPDNFHPKEQTKENKGKHYVWPIDVQGIERKWRYARQSVESVKNLLRVKKSKKGIEIEIGKPYGIVRTVWQDSKYDAAEYGTKLVHALVPKTHFDFPKSVYNVYDCLAPIISERKDAIVLDFFAGSGTTAHAVMVLNKEDDGNRKFIMCTNNEDNNGNGLGIAEGVCFPRIKKVIDGHKDYPDITGIKSNLKYFKTDFVDAEPTDKNKIRLTKEATAMLCLKEDTFEPVIEKEKFKVFRNKDKYTGIILDHRAINGFKKAIKGVKGEFNIYVFSVGDDTFDEEFEDLEQKFKLSPIPEVILRVYRRIFNKL